MTNHPIEHRTVEDQAAELESLLPALMRRLLTLDPSHPVSELPLTQLRVCIVLQSGARPMSEVSEELGISVSAATQVADRLERAGLVERVAEPEDRRLRMLRLTERGSSMMRSRRELRVRRALDALNLLSAETREDLIRTVNALLGAAIATAPEIPNEDPSGIRVQQ